MGIVALLARIMAGYFFVAAAVQATTGDSDISCKYLLGAMATALVGTNAFWGLWVKAILKEKDAVVDARIKDLREAQLKIKTDQ